LVLTEGGSRKTRLMVGRFAKVDFGEQVAIYRRPQRWLSADLGPG
jgi:hypothetical protein